MTEVAIKKKENTAFILQCVVLPSQTSNLALMGTIIKTMRLRLQSDVLGSMLAWCLLFLFFLLGIIFDTQWRESYLFIVWQFTHYVI